MTPLLYLRLAGLAAIVAALIGGYWAIENHGYKRGKAEVQVLFDAYKENIDDQLSKAVAEKKRIEAERNAKLLTAQRDLSNARRDLDSILGRLQDGTFVLRDGSLPVAGCGSDTVPCTPTDTTGATDSPDVTAGIRQTAFYRAAMTDTLQCSRLINFVK